MAVKLYILAGSIHERKLLRLLQDLEGQKSLVDGVLLLNKKPSLLDRALSRIRRLVESLRDRLTQKLTNLVPLRSLPSAWNLSGANSWDLLKVDQSSTDLLSGISIQEHFSLDARALNALKSNSEDEVFIAAYAGGFFTKELLSQPGITFLNAHMGRMPKYRGMAAIEWAMMNQDEPYVSVMKIASAIDGGDELFEVPIGVEGCDTIEKLRRRGYEACSKAMSRAFIQLKKGDTQFKAQQGVPRYNYRMHPFTRKELSDLLVKRKA